MKLVAPLVLACALVAVGAAPGAVRPSTTGVFDTGCTYSHSRADDPLLHPGMAGHSHLHDFFGNRRTAAGSTGKRLVNAIRTSPLNSTCRDKRDGSAYWAPALYQDGKRLLPQKVHVYYRHRAAVPARPFPVGFGMIADRHVWSCGPGTEKRSDGTVPACPGGRLFVILTFPACWDGVRLFSADGSHVSHGGLRCDALHPVRLPRLTMLISYRVDGLPHAYELSSGPPATAHADFLNAWEPSRLSGLVERCLSRGRVMSCEAEPEAATALRARRD
jgi:hypothetical protein